MVCLDCWVSNVGYFYLFIYFTVYQNVLNLHLLKTSFTCNSTSQSWRGKHRSVFLYSFFLFLVECVGAQYKPLPILEVLWNSPVPLESVKIGQFTLPFIKRHIVVDYKKCNSIVNTFLFLMHILKSFLSCNAYDTYYVKENPASFSLVYIYH